MPYCTHGVKKCYTAGFCDCLEIVALLYLMMAVPPFAFLHNEYPIPPCQRLQMVIPTETEGLLFHPSPPPHLFWQTVAPLPPPLFRVDRSGLGPGVHGSVCCIYCGAIGIGCGRNLRGALGRATAKTPKSDLASTPLLMKSQFGMGSPQQNIAVPHWLSTATSGNWKLRCKL